MLTAAPSLQVTMFVPRPTCLTLKFVGLIIDTPAYNGIFTLTMHANKARGYCLVNTMMDPWNGLNRYLI